MAVSAPRRRPGFALAAALLLAGPATRAAAAEPSLASRAQYDPAAALELGMRLELGIGYPTDPARAARLVCQAATAGYPPAARHIAVTLLEPELPGYEPALAGAWLRFMKTRERLGTRSHLPAPPCPDGVVPAHAARPSPFAALAAQLAFERGLSPNLVKAVILAESAWRPEAVSSAGAQGLMQLMPGTARRRGVNDSFDPEQNLRGGMDHLVALMRLFGDPVLALAAYNAGEAPVLACRCVPHIRETEDYILRIKAYGGLDQTSASPGRRGAAPARKP
jgi:soluble lytic murein transglycosylase-like protein